MFLHTSCCASRAAVARMTLRTTLAATTALTLGISHSARAQNAPYPNLAYFAIGPDGTDAHVPLLGNSTASTAGQSGGNLTISYNRAIGGATDGSTPSVNITANGGGGGAGDRSGIGSGQAPSDGGAGGVVLFTNNGTITAINLYPGAPVVQLLARGGVGGYDQSSQTGGRGGNGGNVSYSDYNQYDTPGSITFAAPSQSNLVFDYGLLPTLLLNADASGGAAGITGYYLSGDGAQGASPSTGGDGGSASVVLSGGTLSLSRPAPAPGTTIVAGSATGTPAYVISALANGGQGTSGTDGSPPPGNNGGNGGSVTVSLGAGSSVTGRGDAVTAIFASANGGSGGLGLSAAGMLSNGGAGGAAGSVSVSIGAGANVSAAGDNAPAVIAEALGGSGGSVPNGPNVGLLPSVTGIGGNAGTAARPDGSNAVVLTNAGTLGTAGITSPGIIALSMGGSGGNSGSSSLPLPGGNGGAGGNVLVSNTGSITTNGGFSSGILALSAGGNGGNGSTGSPMALIPVSKGGNGGAAGPGGAVTVTNDVGGSIGTSGDHAIGLLAESLGGGNSVRLFGTDQFAPQIQTPGASGDGNGGDAVGLFSAGGGDGGAGGAGGAVTVTNAGTVTTAGANAIGVLAQSIGGSGGSGGNATSYGVFVSIALGGNGAAGGDGGPVTVNEGAAPGHITTTGVSAAGLFAQSVGGSGGVGGDVNATSVGVLGSVAVAIGGNGGGGGSGGAVTVNNGSAIQTAGNDAPGIIAQSIGGGGGRAGQAAATAVAVGTDEIPAIAVAVSVGGSGGVAGNGGAVTVVNDQAIQTDGVQSPGIKAMSVGGGGGDGANATSVANMVSFTANVGVTVGIGGSGGAAGTGGTIGVTNNAAITTTGLLSPGIAAASIGGGGGDGGIGSATASVGLPVLLGDTANTVATILIPMGDGVTANVAVGGAGGGGGSGGQVNLGNYAAITTQGSQSTGLFAQSVGGGGGMAGGYNGGGRATLSANVTVGGAGGGGGDGGAVTITNAAGAAVRTSGDSSYGIYAQSVGGGGGIGGAFTTQTAGDKNDIAAASQRITQQVSKTYKYLTPEAKQSLKNGLKALGNGAKTLLSSIKALFSSGSSGGGEVVQVTSALKQRLASLLSQGKFLYYVRKGFSGLVKSNFSVPQFSVAVGVGGSGGIAGDGGAVTVQNDGVVATQGANAHAIFAQSIGGGGGAGGGGFSNGNNLLQADVSVGASGGGGGNGGTVTITNTGSITTQGDGAFGILAQSVGGGGGLGGAAENSQTIGVRATVNLGGSAGQNSPGGAVTVTSSGSIVTAGREAHGIFAQSVGGGGGLATVQTAPTLSASSVTSTISDDTATAIAALLLAAQDDTVTSDNAPAQPDVSGVVNPTVLPAISLGLSLGGTGGGGGDGGAVTVDLSGAISTSGMGAFGVFAQSVGGGGGAGAGTQNAGVLGGDLTLGIGGKGGGGGNGGPVTLNFSGTPSITTTGAGATAAVLQSVGGGGGYSGAFTTYLWREMGGSSYVTYNSGASGNGGDITVAMGSPADRVTIATTGVNAHGIFAQTIGGGGGLAADGNGLIVPATAPAQPPGSRANPFNATGGRITINTAGSITALGTNSIGIYAQSGFLRTDGSADPAVAGGDITITHSGTIQGGSGAGSGIRLDGGNNNTVTLASGSLSALSGDAVVASFGNDTLINGGTITGNVLLDGGRAGEVNSFTNQAGATYVAGQRITLGTGTLTNAGTVALGKLGSYDTTALSGNFNQTASGVLITHADFGSGRSSVLAVTGSATVGGTVRVDLTSPTPGHDLPILTADQGLALTATASTGLLVYSYTLNQQGNAVMLHLGADFTPGGTDALTANQRSVADHLQGEWAAGQPDPKYAAFARVLSMGAYTRALNQLSPESSQAPAASQAQTAQTFLGNMMSCPYFAGSAVETTEQDCAWFRTIGGWTQQDASAQSTGYQVSGVTYQIGGQRHLAPGWILGGSAAYGVTRSSGDGGLSSSSGQSMELGVALKHEIDNWLLAGALEGGYGWYKNTRQINFDQTGQVAGSGSRVESVAARLRASRQFPFGSFYLKPYADLDTVYTRVPGYTEHGAGTYDLRTQAADQVTVLGSPMLEVGGRVNLGDHLFVRPFAAFGATVRSNDSFAISARFAASPDQVSPFVTATHVPIAYGNYVAGIDVLATGGLEMKAQYSAKQAPGFLAQEASLRLNYRF